MNAESIEYRLRARAKTRRQTFLEESPENTIIVDRISDLLEEAAAEIERLRKYEPQGDESK